MTDVALTGRVERLGHQGDGILDGPLYAPRTLPGEVVTGRAVGDTLVETRISTPSPHRVRPPCPHYRSCGGCQLQHASDAFVAGWKQEAVEQALAAHGLTAAFRPLATSPPRSRRRATLAAKRTKSGTLLGFHSRGSDIIVDTPDCLLLDPDLVALRPALAALARIGASRKAALSLTVTASPAGADLKVTGGKAIDGALLREIAVLAEGHGIARITWQDEVAVLRERPWQQIGRARITPPPSAFLQATRHGEAVLTATVQEALSGAVHVVDLFAGCGTFSLPLAETARVHAVEGEAAMLEALDEGWRHAEGLRQVTTEARDLFRNPIGPDEIARFDGAVIDPPRAGADAQVATLAKSGIGRICYVSCNPVAFARDAKALVHAGYTLAWIQVVDQFRWSSHIELAAAFDLA